ncbi:hypothetical protein [Kibdelosporangium philippinense]|uniref:hypothetical protein n=1 Tax=Kibdelosporangium philippinense TaxID=211113 RepID=UPI003605B865
MSTVAAHRVHHSGTPKYTFRHRELVHTAPQHREAPTPALQFRSGTSKFRRRHTFSTTKPAIRHRIASRALDPRATVPGEAPMMLQRASHCAGTVDTVFRNGGHGP